MSANQSNPLWKNKGLIHIPSGQIYEFKTFDKLVSEHESASNIVILLDKLYPLNMGNGTDDYHRFLWECASETGRAVEIVTDQMTGNYTQEVVPAFDLTEFEVI